MGLELLSLSQYAFNPFALPPLVVGILTAGLGLVVLVRERGSSVSWAFLWMTLAGAGWLLSYVGIFTAKEAGLAFTWAKIENMGVVFIPSMVLWFTLAVVRRFQEMRACAGLSLVVSLMFLSSIAFTDRFVSGVYSYPWGYFARYGPWTIPFLVFFFGLMVACFHLYRVEYRRAKGRTHRKRLKALLAGFGIAYLGSVDYLPAYGIPVYPIG